MNSLDVEQVSRVYGAKAHLRIHYHPVAHQAFLGFCQARVLFLRSLDQAEGDSYWDDFTSALSRFRFRAASTPLPFETIAQGISSLESPRLRHFVSRAENVYPRLADLADSAVNALEQISASTENPLFDELVRIADARRLTAAVVLRDARLLDTIRAHFQAELMAAHLEVVSPRDLRQDRTFEQLIVIGSPSWYSDFVFSAPRAPDIHVVSFRWDVREWHEARMLPGTVPAGARVRERSDSNVPTLSEDALWPEMNWQRILATSAGVQGEGDGSSLDDIDAWSLVLDGQLAVFLDASEGATCLAIDPEEEGAARLVRTPTKDLVPGMFVLLRTDGEGDYIVPIANLIMGANAELHRNRIRDWKVALRGKSLRVGIIDIVRQLKNLGASRADEINVRNWMSDRNIGPQGEPDFNALMALIGRSVDANEIWKITRQVRAAHLSAGMQVRRRLLEKVRFVDPAEFVTRGRLDFVLPEAQGGRLSAIRIEGRSPATSRVPSSRLSVPFTYEAV